MTVDGPDLVVAGAGGGLVGALRAASLGLSVLVVERNVHFAVGNNTAMSTAMVPGAGSRWQREAGVASVSAPPSLKVAARFTKLSVGSPLSSVWSGPTTTSPSRRSVTNA